MPKYLVRTPMLPFETYPYSEMSAHIGNNLGNMVYSNSVLRSLMIDEDTEFTGVAAHEVPLDGESIERINAEYDAFIIPLADAIRKGFVPWLKRMTKFIKKLRIPCIVIGCGLQGEYEMDSDFHLPFDGAVRNFFSAVSEKSALAGLRGQITADYLTRLGFREDKDFTVIGCPSMYTTGDTLPFRDPLSGLNDIKDAKISYNMSTRATEEQLQFILRSASHFPNAVYVPQVDEELNLMYYGKPGGKVKNPPKSYPYHLNMEPYLSGDCRFFCSSHTWIEFQKTRDLCFGTRVHGNITAVIAGTPSLMIPIDARARELVEYHHLACLKREEIRDDISILDIIHKVDFTSPCKYQAENHGRYVDFLERNGLPHIFNNDNGALFDRKVSEFLKTAPAALTTPINKETPEVIASRLEIIHNEKEALSKDLKNARHPIRHRLGNVKRALLDK